MKKLVLIALALITLQATAQERKDRQKMDKKERAERMSQYTPEEIAEIQTKQMTLQLDLSEAQQKQIMVINVENAKSRKAMMEKRQKAMEDKEKMELTKEDKLKIKNDMLDRQIAMKKQMKDILNKEQYEKWEAMAKEKMKKGRHQKKQMMHKK
ncbi:hypothetical protein [Hanstruepera flava]|uniref:hypothetical protein n=1 Tax=Hanstruepera flava TaxID=2930218 RepID=UPI002029540D|nr:hypothetical protein [Hanstruepera flava]